MKRRPSRLLAALITTAFVALSGAMDARAQQACPSISIECPDRTNAEDEEITFRAVVADADPSLTLTFDWEVSAGTITSGQGTASITVDRTGLGGSGISATLTVGGLPEACEGTASCTTDIIEDPLPRLLDSFGSLNAEAERAHLDGLFDALQSEPSAAGYIIVYAGRRATEGEALKRGERARRYLVEEKSLEADRVVVIDGGHREEVSYELYVVPLGAMPPVASPTVDVSEVEIIREEKRRPARKPPANAPKTPGAKPNP